MIVVPITEKMKGTARAWEAVILSNLKYDINYTGIRTGRAFYWGFLGEFAVGSLLKEHKRQAVYHVNLKGNGDAEDFTLCSPTGSNLAVDVKATSPKAYHNDKLLVNERQHGIKDDRYYMGVYISENEDCAHVWGVMKVRDMLYNKKGFTRKGEPTYYMQFRHLPSIEHFLTVIRQGEFIIKIQK
ncbi:MAG: hypothetical protein MOGMAGMI_01814 [Candidatus Omnitrophica bacterium]|nr:hypothetical protein [Ignavibacteriaceae bacterium]MCG3176850.1 hypothetical protein [Candidatus Omnitrophota bacterium]